MQLRKRLCALFARTWTVDLKNRNIRVNALSPGSTYTPGVAKLANTDEDREGLYAHLASMAPLGRMGQPVEIAKAAVFLASDDESFVAGLSSLSTVGPWEGIDISSPLESFGRTEQSQIPFHGFGHSVSNRRELRVRCV